MSKTTVEGAEEVGVSAQQATPPKHQYELPVPEENVYKASYGILVVCDSEEEQAAIFTNVKALGYQDVRVLTV